LLSDLRASLVLEDFVCGGDDSRLCCMAPAYGQSVIATGRLSREYGGSTAHWRLREVRLCLDSRDGG
jgi:hypothetical protein